jgi:aspartyl-tRNA(Asn)/glutamyl-tRNA(Gln) amidotransferase subunit C
MTTVSRDELRELARLARLQLTDDELDGLQSDLTDILDHMNALRELDTTGVEPMTHAMDMGQRLRDGSVAESLPRDEALAAAPRTDDGSFVVPAILPSGEGS